MHQDIRPLKIAILNLMPTKIATETQLLRLLGNTAIQVELTLARTASHQSKNTPEEHLLTFYQTFDQIRDQKFDALIITGAPVEHLPFEEVDYWDELKDHHGLGSGTMFFHCCIFAGGRRPPCTTSLGCPNTRFRPNSSAFSRTGWLSKMSNCCAALMIFFMRRIHAIRKSAAQDIEKVPELEILAESDSSRAYISPPPTMGARFLSPAIRNMTR